MELLVQILWLFLLAIPISCITWTITHEELFKEVMDYLRTKSENEPDLLKKKLYYVCTCEYCLSHYITAFFLLLTGYTLLFSDWRGYLISFFSLVWIANIYMSLFASIRISNKLTKTDTELKEQEVDKNS